MITVSQNNVFHLSTEKTSYLFRVMKSGHLEALYYGRKIRNNTSFEYLYDKHVRGFANSVASPAIEFKTEGLVYGLAAKMFIVAGPIIVYGVLAGAIVGLLYLFL